ncbi:uncharacterized protein LOC133182897 [Saccostrea echinata]|uniref:uncharacterized protein LOC133182897 n=1 Tax=Saccostrea echinata TaxID=191078 RepID=UPI002A82943E|nr:uncharacterized protein LOC133182897 [Saccostrea echinata]
MWKRGTYSQTEKEALAIVWGIEHFHLYLFGAEFILTTDYKPLEIIFDNTRSKSPARIERWRLRLQPYDFTVEYRSGKGNQADYISWHPLKWENTFRHSKIAEEFLNFVLYTAKSRTLLLKQITDASDKDHSRSNIKNAERRVEDDSKRYIDTDGLHHRYYVTESFPHFNYVYNLVKDCEFRLRKISDEIDEVMTPPNELIIKISFADDVSKEDLRIISKKRSSKKRKVLNKGEACHKILIKTQYDDNTGNVHHSIAVVDRNREKIQEAITSCLEETLIRTLEKWIKAVGSVSSKAASKLNFEMKSVLKHIFKLNLPATLSKAKSVVPFTIKEYQAGVNSFGLWRNGVFKVFVACSTDKGELNDELKLRDPDFFEKYKLEIKAKKFVQKKTLKQGDAILGKEGDTVYSATLGGLVKEKDNDDNIYGLTCNHIYPQKSQSSYASPHGEDLEIGKCVYTTRNKSCDFAVVKIKEE